MNEFLHIGFDSYVNVSKVLFIFSADAERVNRELKRRVIEKNSSTFWDSAPRKETKSLIIMEGGTLIASAVSTETLVKRFQELKNGGYKE